MDVALKELAKLEKLTSDAKGKSAAVVDSLDALLASLRGAQVKLQEGSTPKDSLENLAKSVETHKKAVDDRQKEVYSSMSRLGKAFDKVGWVDNLYRLHELIFTLNRSSQIHYLNIRHCSPRKRL